MAAGQVHVQMNAVRAGARRRAPAGAVPVQSRTAAQDVDGMTRAECSSCQITYYVPVNRKKNCPLCDAEDQVRSLHEALMEAQNTIEMLSNERRRAQVELDVILAIRSALEVASPTDATFLKSVLYRYRADHTAFAMRATRAEDVNGFLLMPKRGDPEAHACDSIGGLAIASYYDELTRSQGQIKALEILMHALGRQLAPGT